MEFRVLGPLEVRRDGGVVELRGSKRRAVLSLLVLHANEVVRVDRLIEEVWGEEPPANAAAALRNHVSRLRKDVGGDVLVTKPWGYVLRTDPAAIDLHRFERLVAAAKPLAAHERTDLLAEALALWRGPALADLAHEPAVAGEISRLEELRLAAIEQRIDADLELGRHDELVPELEALVAEQPLRERFRGQLILALYRSGRQGEALETYRETRRVLVEELGIEPSSELRELERAILRQDPALASAPPTPAADVELFRSRWRWPRSPLTAAAVLVLLAGAGVAAAVIATHGGASVDRGALAAAQSLASTSASAAAKQPVATSPTLRPREQARRNREKNSAAGRANSNRAHARPTASRSDRSRVRPTPTAPPSTTTTARPSTTTAARPSTTTTASSTTTAAAQLPTLADRTAWWTGANQRQLSVMREDGQVTISIPGDASDGFNTTVTTRCRIVGDFDAQASFQLLQWPGADGIWVSLMAADLGGVNAYRTDAFGETYGTYIPPSGGTSVPAAGRSGVLRLTRQGGKITGSYRAGGDWVTIFGGRGPTANTAISLSVFNLPDVAPFAGGPATVRFTAFTLAAKTLDC